MWKINLYWNSQPHDYESPPITTKTMSRIKTFLIMGRSPGLVVMGGDSCSKGHGFKSRHCKLDGHFFTYIWCIKCIDVCLKRPKINDKRCRGWPIKTIPNNWIILCHLNYLLESRFLFKVYFNTFSNCLVELFVKNWCEISIPIKSYLKHLFPDLLSSKNQSKISLEIFTFQAEPKFRFASFGAFIGRHIMLRLEF